MSGDEFDQGIERLFNRAPILSDASEFEARVMGRLQNNSRVRGIVLGCAGLLGGIFAVNEMVGLTFRMDGRSFQASAGDGSEAAGGAIRDGSMAVQGLVDSLGIGGLDLTSVTQTQSLLGVACMMIALLTLGAVKLYQQV